MINIPPIKPSAEIITELLPDIGKTWRIGQTLSATAERGGEALDKILLRIGRYQLEARTPVPIKTGEQVKLLVKSLGETPLLSIQTGAVDNSKIAAEQLRGVIAQQQDVSGLFRLAQQLTGGEQLSAPIRNQLRELLQLLPRSEQLSNPQQLKTAIRNSGLFLESRLLQQTRARQPDSLQPDIKAALLKISELIQKTELPVVHSGKGRSADLGRAIEGFIQGDISLRQLASTLSARLSPAELTAVVNFLSSRETILPPALALKLPQIFQHIQQQPDAKQLMDSLFSLLRNLPPLQQLKTAVDNSLARITSQQLMPLSHDRDMPMILQFDLPVRDRDHVRLFKFNIEEDNSSTDSQRSSWSITINFDFEPLGPVQARLHLMDKQITTVLQAEKDSTVTHIQDNIGLLEQGFARAGLRLLKLDVIAGRPAEPLPVARGVRILDEEA